MEKFPPISGWYINDQWTMPNWKFHKIEKVQTETGQRTADSGHWTNSNNK